MNSSNVCCEGEALRKVFNTKGLIGRSTQLAYHATIAYGLSAEAVGMRQIFGFVL
jgi:hypothetical protein